MSMQIDRAETIVPGGEEIFFAHSLADCAEADWHTLVAHLRATAERAHDFAEPFGAGALGYAAGLLHDLGKYAPRFQARLRGAAHSVDHSTWGARIACERYGPLGRLLAYGIAGHHAGLANGRAGSARTALQERLEAELPELDPAWQQELPLPTSLPEPASFTQHRDRALWAFQLGFLGRMLFSCLVDADYLDTEAFYLAAEGRASARQAPAPELTALRDRLDVFLAGFRPDGNVNRVRAQILAAVRAKAARSPGLFSLTVPTGGGKTLASLAFALDHALAHGMQRVIYVIPFTSIVEQNAAVFRRAFGDLGARAVLEHHSAFVDSPGGTAQGRDKLRLAMENWDAPVVVTTAVQFFESLFADRPSKCRKLHNIANSVVILDEAQTLPLRLLLPSVAALDELARNYRTSVVLCTATQPALQAAEFVGRLEGVTELAPEPRQLAARLARVRVRHVGRLDDAALTAHLQRREQVLCIVNNRRHARALFEAIADQPGAFHLSTLMCARHRSAVLAEVREALQAGVPCRLVSTSLIEAGVDVDFPTVLRAEAGLDSIAQAAGRCNREGQRAPADSEVLIFAPDNEAWAPPHDLLQFAQAAREVLRRHENDPLSLEAIEEYFLLLYWQRGAEQLDEQGLLPLTAAGQLDGIPYEELASKFRFIDSAQLPVLVPYDAEARSALRELEFAERCGGLARHLQPYLVQLPKQGYNALREAGAIQPVAPERFGEQFMVLVNPDAYDPRYGLRWDDPGFVRAERLVW